jgi:GxxExxY protein
MVSLLYRELTYKIIGAAMTVHRSLGPVHKEGVYQKALAREFELRKIPFKREVSLDVFYEGRKVGNYRPDFVVDEKVLVEIKAVNFLPKAHESQLTYYLKGTGFKIGLLINFGAKKLDFRRRIYEKEYKKE